MGLETCACRGQNDDFLMFGGLGGDICKDIYEPKLCWMHSGSVLSGWNAGNVNNDAKISIVGFGDVCV